MLDTGLTLGFLLERLRARQPASLKLCVLLNKRIKRSGNIAPDYTGFDAPAGFVVGYGIDYAERYRHLPAIYTLAFAAAEASPQTVGQRRRISLAVHGFLERTMLYDVESGQFPQRNCHPLVVQDTLLHARFEPVRCLPASTGDTAQPGQQPGRPARRGASSPG
jgi:hypothetical protein